MQDPDRIYTSGVVCIARSIYTECRLGWHIALMPQISNATAGVINDHGYCLSNLPNTSNQKSLTLLSIVFRFYLHATTTQLEARLPTVP